MWHNIFTFVWFACTLRADMKNLITEKIIQQILALKKKYRKQPIYYEETSMFQNIIKDIKIDFQAPLYIFVKKIEFNLP